MSFDPSLVEPKLHRSHLATNRGAQQILSLPEQMDIQRDLLPNLQRQQRMGSTARLVIDVGAQTCGGASTVHSQSERSRTHAIKRGPKAPQPTGTQPKSRCRPPRWWRGAKRTLPATRRRATWCLSSCRRLQPGRFKNSGCARWRRRCDGQQSMCAWRYAWPKCTWLEAFHISSPKSTP